MPPLLKLYWTIHTSHHCAHHKSSCSRPPAQAHLDYDRHTAHDHVQAQPVAPAVAPWRQAELAAAHKVLKVWQPVLVTDKHTVTKLVGLRQLPQLLHRHTARSQSAQLVKSPCPAPGYASSTVAPCRSLQPAPFRIRSQAHQHPTTSCVVRPNSGWACSMVRLPCVLLLHQHVIAERRSDSISTPRTRLPPTCRTPPLYSGSSV